VRGDRHHPREQRPRNHKTAERVLELVVVGAVGRQHAGARRNEVAVRQPEASVGSEGRRAERVAGGKLPRARDQLHYPAEEIRHPDNDVRLLKPDARVGEREQESGAGERGQTERARVREGVRGRALARVQRNDGPGDRRVQAVRAAREYLRGRRKVMAVLGNGQGAGAALGGNGGDGVVG
jgi:hypothetical protein